MKELASHVASTPTDNFIGLAALCLNTFADECGDYMRGLGIKIISRAIKIDGQQEDRVHPILLPVRLRLHQHHFLGETVRCISLLRKAIPQIIFAKRNWRELRIRANGTNSDELGKIALASLFHKLSAHHEIVIEVLARTSIVGSNSSNDCCQVNHEIWSSIVIEASHRIDVDKIVF